MRGVGKRFRRVGRGRGRRIGDESSDDEQWWHPNALRRRREQQQLSDAIARARPFTETPQQVRFVTSPGGTRRMQVVGDESAPSGGPVKPVRQIEERSHETVAEENAGQVMNDRKDSDENALAQQHDQPAELSGEGTVEAAGGQDDDAENDTVVPPPTSPTRRPLLQKLTNAQLERACKQQVCAARIKKTMCRALFLERRVTVAGSQPSSPSLTVDDTFQDDNLLVRAARNLVHVQRRQHHSAASNEMLTPDELPGGRAAVATVIRREKFVQFDLIARQIYEMSSSSMPYDSFIRWMTQKAPLYANWVPESAVELTNLGVASAREFVRCSHEARDGDKLVSPLTPEESALARKRDNAVFEAAIALSSSRQELDATLAEVHEWDSRSTKRRLVNARAVYVYSITVEDSVLLYVGESVDIESRMDTHISYLFKEHASANAQDGHKLAREHLAKSSEQMMFRAWALSVHSCASLQALAKSYIDARAHEKLSAKCSILELATVIGSSGLWLEAYYTARLGSLMSASTEAVLGMNVSQPGIPFAYTYKVDTIGDGATRTVIRCLKSLSKHPELLEEFKRRVGAGDSQEFAANSVWMKYVSNFWRRLDDVPAREYRVGQTGQLLTTQRAVAQSIAFTGVHHKKSRVATMYISVRGEEHCFVFEGTSQKDGDGALVSFDNMNSRDELKKFVALPVVQTLADETLLTGALELKAAAKGSARFSVHDPLYLTNKNPKVDPAQTYDPRQIVGNLLYMGSIGPEPVFEITLDYDGSNAKSTDTSLPTLASILSSATE